MNNVSLLINYLYHLNLLKSFYLNVRLNKKTFNSLTSTGKYMLNTFT